MTMKESFGDIFEAVSKAVPGDRPAIICNGAVTNWNDLARRSNALAAAFQQHGIRPGAKVAHYMRNTPAYLETSFACFLAGLVHVNINFRYGEEELFFIFDNSDSEIVVYDSDFAPMMASLRPRLGKVRLFVEVAQGKTINGFARSFEELAQAAISSSSFTRSPKDLLFIYTGGTTGMPKGVMWEHDNLWAVLGGGAPLARGEQPQTLAAIADNAKQRKGYEASLVCPPLMHGAGYLKAVYTLLMGGTVAMLTHFNARDALRLIAEHRLASVVIVGDAFGRPLLKELDANPEAYDISSLKFMTSGGAMWSQDVKTGLLRHNPAMLLVDAYGSSESIAIGTSVSRSDGPADQTRFKHNKLTRVLDDDGNEVPAGSDIVGRVARTGPLPLGYYKDQEKTDRTFITIRGERYVFPGDYARVMPDGSINLLGRGNMCINTGGEKVFPEEIEESLKHHPAVDDALVFGLPDETWGQAVNAVVEVSQETDALQLREYLQKKVAGYKVPKRIVIVPKVPRTPSGKPDYDGAKLLFAQEKT